MQRPADRSDSQPPINLTIHIGSTHQLHDLQRRPDEPHANPLRPTSTPSDLLDVILPCGAHHLVSRADMVALLPRTRMIPPSRTHTYLEGCIPPNLYPWHPSNGSDGFSASLAASQTGPSAGAGPGVPRDHLLAALRFLFSHVSSLLHSPQPTLNLFSRVLVETSILPSPSQIPSSPFHHNPTSVSTAQTYMPRWYPVIIGLLAVLNRYNGLGCSDALFSQLAGFVAEFLPRVQLTLGEREAARLLMQYALVFRDSAEGAVEGLERMWRGLGSATRARFREMVVGGGGRLHPGYAAGLRDMWLSIGRIL